MKPIVFNNLDEIVIEKEHVSTKKTREHWSPMAYETGDVHGTMLLAGENTFPQDVTLHLGLTGWHKIYVCQINLRSQNYIMLKLTGDKTFQRFRSPYIGAQHRWCPTEMVEEFLWKCADLTGQDVILSKFKGAHVSVSNLVWIKCVPMTEAEIAAHLQYQNTQSTRCLHAHCDGDIKFQTTSMDMAKVLSRFGPYCNTDVKEVSLEMDTYPNQIDTNASKEVYLHTMTEKQELGHSAFGGIKAKAHAAIQKLLHDNGISIYAAHRMSVASFQVPTDCRSAKMPFCDNNPQFHAVMRDGSRVKICSYAYPEVQDYMLGVIKKDLEGFDGVTLLMHRGLHIGFDAPVIQRFQELYPDLDPFTLPMHDRRLNGVWCSFMTEFMRKLRKMLDEASDRHLKVNVVTEYSPTTNLLWGLDVEQWAEEGLIDAILQGNMETSEQLDGCLKEDGAIDLELYKEKLKKDFIVIRTVPPVSVERAIAGFEACRDFCKKYGVTFHAAFPWEHRVAPGEYPEIICRFKEAGITDYFMWDAHNAMDDLPEFHALSMAGHDVIDPETYQVNRYRVLSLDGSNISAFNPNWRG